MKKTKALFALFVACMMILSACGNSNTPSDGGSSSEGSVVRIGGIGPLTSDYANYGLSVRNGAQIAVDEINAAGGVNGMTFELDFQDSVADADQAVAAYGKLLDNGMHVSIGTVLSGEMASVSKVGAEDDIFMISPSASADKAIEQNDKAFRVCFKDSDQGTFSADYIHDHNMATEVAVLYQSDIDYSIGLFEAFEKRAQELGIKIVEVQTFDSNTNTDFTTQVSALSLSGAKVIFIPIYAAEASVFLSQAKGKIADDVLYFGCDGLDGILSKVENDVSLADNVMELTPFSADDTDPDVQKFVTEYKTRFNATPDQFAADGYDAVYVIKAIIEKANITKPEDCSGTLMAQTITTITVEGITGTMTWTADGNTVKDAKAMIIQDGVASLYQG